jgi:hypothetical protein
MLRRLKLVPFGLALDIGHIKTEDSTKRNSGEGTMIGRDNHCSPLHRVVDITETCNE